MDADPGPSTLGLYLLDAGSWLLGAGLSPWIGLPVLLLLLLCSALISGSEVAFFSLTNKDFTDLGDDASAAARRIVRLKEEPYKLLATILITNNFINIAIVLLAEIVLDRLFPEAMFARWSRSIVDKASELSQTAASYMDAEQLQQGIQFAITVIGVTFLLVLFGEVTPKVYARAQNVRLAKWMSGVLTILTAAFSPLASALVRSGSFLESRLRRHQGAQTVDREELDAAIDLTVRDEQELAGERDILKRLVTFGDVTVRQIMQSRSDIEALDTQSSFADVLERIRQSSYSRIPVYEESLDTIIGILYAKDLICHLHQAADYDWRQHVRDSILYTPESKRVHDQLREFQAERVHMAIVVDEFGGTSGLVTLEDILEEVLGDIKDEFDDELEIDYVQLDERTYLFEGKTQLSDALRIVGLPSNFLDDHRGEADTLAGVMIEHIGFLPRAKREVVCGGLVLQAEAVTRRRIERIRVITPRPAAEVVNPARP